MIRSRSRYEAHRDKFRGGPVEVSTWQGMSVDSNKRRRLVLGHWSVGTGVANTPFSLYFPT
jgi:hypothetical protein